MHKMGTTQMLADNDMDPKNYQVIGIIVGICTSTLISSFPLHWIVRSGSYYWIILILFFLCQLLAWFGLRFLNQHLQK